MPEVTKPVPIDESSDVVHDDTTGGTDGNPHTLSAELDDTGVLRAGQLPDLAVTNTSTVTAQSDLTSLAAEQGDVAIVTDDSQAYILTTDDPTALGNWVVIKSPPAPVDDVFGRTGSVNPQSGDYSASEIADFASAALSAINGEIDATATSVAGLDDATNSHIGASNPHAGSADTNHGNEAHSESYTTAAEAAAAAPVSSVNGSTGDVSIAGAEPIGLTQSEFESFIQSNAAEMASSPATMGAIASSAEAMERVAASNTAMQEIVSSQTAMSSVAGSPAALKEMADSQTAMSQIDQSDFAVRHIMCGTTTLEPNSFANADQISQDSEAMAEVASNPTTMVGVSASQTAMAQIATSDVAMKQLAAFENAMRVVAASQTAMQEIASRQSAMEIVTDSATATRVIASSRNALDVITRSNTSVAESTLLNSTSATETFSNSPFVENFSRNFGNASNLGGSLTNKTVLVVSNNSGGSRGTGLGFQTVAGTTTEEGSTFVTDGVNLNSGFNDFGGGIGFNGIVVE